MNRKIGNSTEVTVGGNDRSPGSELRESISYILIFIYIYREREGESVNMCMIP